MSDLAIYDFEDDLSDSLSLAADGVATGAVSFTTTAPYSGAKSIAPTVPGNGSYIDFPLSLINTSQGSVEFAFKTGATVAANQLLWWGGGNGTPSNRTIEYHIIAGSVFGVVNNAGLPLSGPLTANTEYYGKVTWNAEQVIFMLADRSGSATSNPLIVNFSLDAPLWGVITNNRIFNGFNSLDTAHITAFDWLRFTDTFNTDIPSPTPTGPDPATNLAVVSTGATSLELTWTDGANTTGQLVYRNTVNNFATASPVGVVFMGVERFKEYGLTTGQTYYYWLVAFSS